MFVVMKHQQSRQRGNDMHCKYYNPSECAECPEPVEECLRFEDIEKKEKAEFVEREKPPKKGTLAYSIWKSRGGYSVPQKRGFA